MPGLDTNVIVNVFTDAPPITGAGFGVPLYLAAPGSLGVGFTERVRFYDSPGAVAADLAATDLSQAAHDACISALSQSPRTSRVAVGRVEAGTAGVYTVTVAGTVADAENFTVNVDGHEVSYDAVVPTDDADAVATALQAALVALQPGALSHVTFGAVAAGAFTVTANTGSVAVDVQAETDSAAATISVAETTPPGDIATELSSLLAEESGWYVLCCENKTPGFILEVAAWVEAQERVYLAQTDAPDTLTTSTTCVASQLADAARARTALCYHHDNAEEFAFAWAAKTLQADPDNTTTTWAYKRLSGITASSLTTTQANNLQGKNANLFWTFFSFSTSWEGLTAEGQYLDVRLTQDWVAARTRETVAQMYVDVSNQNGKVPYTDEGIQQHAGVILGVLKRGESAGHFVVDSSTIQAPLSADVPTATKQARELTIGFTTQLAGAIHQATINGYVLITLP